jgi:hypothetical protein
VKQLVEYAPFAVLILQGLTFWACWSLRQIAKTEVRALKEAHDAEILQLKLDQRDFGTRLDGVEDDIPSLPTKADIAALSGRIDGLSHQITTVNAGVDRIEGYFLERGVRG